jgi:hypothetical protein
MPPTTIASIYFAGARGIAEPVQSLTQADDLADDRQRRRHDPGLDDALVVYDANTLEEVKRLPTKSAGPGSPAGNEISSRYCH